MRLIQLSTRHNAFPDPSRALDEPNGLLAYGGDLSPARLKNAYRSGVFPWFNQDEPLLWWSPDPRCVIQPTAFRPSRSLKKAYRQWQPTVTLNQAFPQVISQCASVKRREHGTWILPEMLQAYIQLHQQGLAHSIEIWDQQQLVGGLYGVSSGCVFSGESMFHTRANASKIAFWAICELFGRAGGELIDCQLSNPHLISLGAVEIPRQQYLAKLRQNRDLQMPHDFWAPREIDIGETHLVC